MPGVMLTSSDAADRDARGPGCPHAAPLRRERYASLATVTRNAIPLTRTATQDAGAPPVHGIHHYPCLANAVASAATRPATRPKSMWSSCRVVCCMQ